MRNLLLVHLESLNTLTYQMNRDMFPTLRKWEEKSLVFTNYFSTATSTYMVISDMAYGGMLQNEPCDSMDSHLHKYCYKSSLLDELKENGYTVHAVDYPADGDAEKCNERDFLGYSVKMTQVESYEQYLQFLQDVMSKERPFAIWACNYISNVTCHQNVKDSAIETGLEQWESGYADMDNSVGDLMDILENNHLAESTTIIFYGDHGDDFFSHGRHGGLTHAIEPYASLINTPLWIYDNRFCSGSSDALLDTTDIRGLIMQLLQLPEEEYRLTDINIPLRKYSLARNLFAAQRVREKSFHKGYSLTDGRFLFLASDNGMELFHIKMDPVCQHNLLDYFDLQENKLSLNERAYHSMKYHFNAVVDSGSLAQTEHYFYAFRKQLMEEVKELYQYAECEERYWEIDFEQINYGHDERERRRQDGEERNMVISDTLNRLLNSMQVNELAVYGDVKDELQGLYPAVMKSVISHPNESIKCEVMYLALKNADELHEIATWVEWLRQKITMLIYIRENSQQDKDTEESLNITYRYHNSQWLDGTLYFMGKIFEYPDLLVVPKQFRVLAVIHFYNEADILEMTIKYLLENDIDIYLADNWSDDGGYEIAQRYREKYPQRVFLEQFPKTGPSGNYDWYHQLERTEQITEEIAYDWYIHYDVDEMRLGPWRDKNLRETLYYIDQLGYNAVDNTVIDFKLTKEDENNIFMCDTYFDFRHTRDGYLQRKTWKRTDGIELKKSAGHTVRIEEPKIFPLKILNRHYPLRSAQQAHRKIFVDRKPRFAKERKERGWHGHYEDIHTGKDLFTPADNLITWDGSVWDKYYISLFMGCAIRIDDPCQFDTYRNYLEGKRVVLYGAGTYGKYWCEQMAAHTDIVAWIDRDCAHLPWYCCREIQPVECIKELEFDAVFIAVARNGVRERVKETLIQMGVPAAKIY